MGLALLRRPSSRQLWPVVAIVAVAALLGGWALRATASGHDAAPAAVAPPASATAGPTAGSLTSVTTPTPSLTRSRTPPIPTPPVARAGLSPTMTAVTGLLARSAKTTMVELRWHPVAGAVAYQVRRDAGLATESVRRARTNLFGDRPGDSDLHEYTVVALDRNGLPGPVGQPVKARVQAPYGVQQPIASLWPAVVPGRVGAKGSAGQTCRPVAHGSGGATDKIVCRFHSGVRFEIARYAGPGDRDGRANELAAGRRVNHARWKMHRPGGPAMSGRLLSSAGSKASGAWRWWTFDSDPEYSMFASWPHHNAKELTRWWRKMAPFRL